MGYELHITRAEDWPESADHPISRDEWDAVAAASPSLTPNGTVTFATDTIPVFDLADSAGGGPSLHWYEGRVVIKGMRERHIPELAELASRLGARLIGDDGEEYPGG